MSKRLRVLGNQRIDLEDFLHGGSGFAVAELKVHVQQMLSELMGVIEGFDVALDGIPGSDTNVIRIYNGAALDPTLQLVHIEDAPGGVVTLALEGEGLHHVGVLFRLVPSDTAARYFWDPGAQNTDGTNGREFVQDVRTRLSVTWQPVDALDDPTFATSGVDTPHLVIPLAVIPVIAPQGRSVIDESRLRTEGAIGKVLSLGTSDPTRTTLRVVRAALFRPGSALGVPLSQNAYSVDAIDPVRNQLVVTPPMPPADQARAVSLGFVANLALSLPPSTWGYRFIRGVGRLADPSDPADQSAPGDVRPRLFEGDARRGEKLLARVVDMPDRLGGMSERLTGREEDDLGTLKNLRDALAFVLAEAKFGRPGTWAPVGTDTPAPKWIDPVPVPLWDIARLYFNELNGTGVIEGGLPTQIDLVPGAAPGQFTARVHFPATTYYSAGVRHRMAATVDAEPFALNPPARILFVYFWATPQPNTDDPSIPLTGPDWQTAPTRLQHTTTPEFHPDPAAPTARSVLLGAARFDNGAGAAVPVVTLIPMARVPRRIADVLGPDAQGHLQRDLVFRTWAAIGDPGRRITVDDPSGRLHIDVGTGSLGVHAPGAIELLSDLPGAPASIRAHQGNAQGPITARLDATGLDLARGAGARLWDASLGGRGDLLGAFEPGQDRGGGLRALGRRASLVGYSGDSTVAAALRLDARDGFDQDGWSDGVVAVDAEVLEVRRRLRLMGQAAMINVDRDATGNPVGPQGFNFINPYKVPLAWAYLRFDAGLWRLLAQSHCMLSEGGTGTRRADPVWLAPFAQPVAPTPALVEVVGPSSSSGATYGVQLPWSTWFRPTAPEGYIVTLQVNPRYEAWRNYAMLGAQQRRPYSELRGFCTSADVAWRGFARDLRFDSGTVVRAVDGPILVYTFPSAALSGIDGVMVQVWGSLGQVHANGETTLSPV